MQNESVGFRLALAVLAIAATIGGAFFATDNPDARSAGIGLILAGGVLALLACRRRGYRVMIDLEAGVIHTYSRKMQLLLDHVRVPIDSVDGVVTEVEKPDDPRYTTWAIGNDKYIPMLGSYTNRMDAVKAASLVAELCDLALHETTSAWGMSPTSSTRADP